MGKERPIDEILQEDLKKIAAYFPFCDELRGKTVLVTGATGLIGSQIVRALLGMNRLKKTEIKVIAFVRSQEKAEKVFGGLLKQGELELAVGDINQPITLDGGVDYIIHGASATSSQYFVSHPVETIFTAIDGTRHVLELAAQKRVSGFVYLSSLEVYGTPAADVGLIDEEYSGYLDPLQVRSSYSEGKRMVECLCASYAAEYGVPVKIARLSQTFGPGVAYRDGRVFAEFARCAIEGRDIVLHTAGNTVRSYCYTRDAVNALLYILLRGKPGQAYNVTNMDTAVSIREMAQLVCGLVPEQGIQLRFDTPENLASFGYNPEMVICLDSRKLQSLGWQAEVGLEEMFRRLILSMKDAKTGGA